MDFFMTVVAERVKRDSALRKAGAPMDRQRLAALQDLSLKVRRAPVAVVDATIVVSAARPRRRIEPVAA